MKTFNYVNLMLLFVVTFALTSCGDDNYYTDDFLKNSDEKLCSKAEWVDEYMNEDETMLYQRTLTFKIDGRGVDTDKTFSRLPNGNWNPVFSESAHFEWSWADKDMERLILDYWNKKLYFDNVWIREHYLTGKLNGVTVAFRDSRYPGN